MGETQTVAAVLMNEVAMPRQITHEQRDRVYQ